jgi:hypothetical protein
VLEDPFVGDDVEANRMRDKIPSIAGDQRIIFFIHGTRPGWVDEGGVDGGGLQGERHGRRWGPERAAILDYSIRAPLTPSISHEFYG